MAQTCEQERDAMLVLGLAPGLGPRLTNRCIEAFGSAEATVGATAGQLAQIQGISPKQAATLARTLGELADGPALAQEKQLTDQWQVRVVLRGEPDYPALLAMIPDAPTLLYVRGELRPNDHLAIGIVGSRRCSEYGRHQAGRFGSLAASAGMTVVSGGAAGIDAAAHRGALRARGRTIAVLGSGIARPYPDFHVELFDQIVAEGGAVISELPMTAPPLRQHFPQRNRIISGLSLGVLVIEAALRSGALITARQANDDHNREVMALPGPVDAPTSAGCHLAIREGWAALVTSIGDVLDCLKETGAALKASLPGDPDQVAVEPDLFTAGLSEAQQMIVHALRSPLSLDDLAMATSLPVHKLQADLTMLEIRGMVQRQGSMLTLRR